MASPRLPVAFVMITLTLDAIGFGLIMPVMPALLREVTGGDLAQAALWGGALTGGFAVMQFLFGPVVGNLSDRFGRKPVLLVSLGVLVADYIVLALAGSVWLIYAARLMTGAAAATQGTAMAYVADISTPEEKGRRFGLIGAAFGIGFVLGPALGGLLAEFGLRAPFVAAALVAAGNLAFGALVMRESLTPENRRPFDLRRANPFGAFRALGRLPGLRRFLTMYTAHEFGFAVYPVIWAYYCMAAFGWGAMEVGLSLAAYGICFALVQGALIGPVLARLGRRRTMLVGLVAAVVSLVPMVWISSGAVAMALIPLSSLAGLFMPALRATMSDMVGADRQGELQGGLSSLRALGMIAAPFVYSALFAAFTGADAPLHLPGAVFAVPVLLNLGALALLLRAKPQ